MSLRVCLVAVFYHAPIKILNKKDQKLKAKPWISKGIIVSIKKKNLMFKSAIKDKTKKFSITFKKYRNILNRVIERSKILYFKEVVNKNMDFTHFPKIRT